MSAQLKSFEGPDVQVLLDRIRIELGPGAKIDGAEKIRVGGVLGFFAKEHYRVVVEVPASSEAHAPAATDAGTDGSSRRGRHPQDVSPVPVTASASASTTDVFSVMADATDDVVDIGSSRVHGAPAPAPTAPAPTTPAPSVRAPAASAAAAVTDPAVGAESFDAVLTRVATTLEATGPGSSSGPGSPVDAGGSRPDDGTGEPADIAVKAALFLAESTPMANGTTATNGTAPDDALVVALRRTGLDEALVGSVRDGLRAGGDLEALLLEACGALPPAPGLPGRAGSLLVVVGAGVPARRLAAAVAGEIGIDPAAVPFASLDAHAYAVVTGKLLVRSAEDAAEHAPGWRRSEAAVVVVDAPVAGGDRSWATHLIASLRPTAVWGVVDSTSKIEDVATWARCLGGLDAVALENTDATVSPAAALGLGIPVARLNGQPATAARWVATLVDRIGPCP